MDIPCTICGEPFDMDELHYIAEETNTAYDQVREKFYRDGCNIVLGSATRCRPTGNSSARFALADILGSDIDGYASLAEDFKHNRHRERTSVSVSARSHCTK
jgi:hypothetical protein